MLRKSVVVFTVFAFVFGMAGLALAANRVEVKVTSEPIAQGSTCAKAGGFSLEWDEGSVIRQGDQITIDVQFGATLCRAIDFIVAADNTFTRRTDTGALVIDPAVPFSDLNDIPTPDLGTAPFMRNTTLPAAYTINNGGIFFWVHGEVGSQRVTIDIIGSDQATATEPLDATRSIEIVDDGDPNTARTLQLTILDSRTNKAGLVFPNGYVDPDPIAADPWTFPLPAALGIQGIFEASAPDANNLINYYGAAELDDNTLCINVSGSDFAGTIVKASMDSRNDQFQFIPSDPQIAHIASASDVILLPCKDAILGAIRHPKEQGDCVPADLETGAGYWPIHRDNLIVLQKTSGAFTSDDQYEVTLEIVEPASGVYWSNTAVGYASYKSVDGCTLNTQRTVGAWNQATTSYWNRAATKLRALDIVAQPTSCVIPDAAKATKLTTPSLDVFGAAVDATGIVIDIPAIIYDQSVVEGSEVRVEITFSKTPCGALVTDDFSMGEFGIGSDNTLLVYPYFTEMAGTYFWNGITVSNMSNVDGNAKLFVYESDGDQATLDIEVKANETYVNLLSNLIGNMTVTKNVTGLGDSKAYVWVCADFLADGFAMIASESVGDDASESMGYLPRIWGNREFDQDNDYRDFCRSNFTSWK